MGWASIGCPAFFIYVKEFLETLLRGSSLLKPAEEFSYVIDPEVGIQSR